MSGMNLEKIHYTTWGTESQFFTVWRTLTFFEKPTTEISEDLLPFFFPTHYLIFCSYRYSLLFFLFFFSYSLFIISSVVSCGCLCFCSGSWTCSKCMLLKKQYYFPLYSRTAILYINTEHSYSIQDTHTAEKKR